MNDAVRADIHRQTIVTTYQDAVAQGARYVALLEPAIHSAA